MKLVSGYYTTDDLADRFKVHKETIKRWCKRKNHPLPKPRLKGAGSANRWAIEDVTEWENTI